MSGLLTALLLGGALTLLAAGLTWLAGLVLQARAGQSSPALWRSARLVAILPLLLAPVLFAIPQTLPPLPALEFMDELALDRPETAPVRDVPAVTPAAVTLPALQTLLAAVYAIGLMASLLFALRRHYHRRHLLAHSRVADASERSLLDREAGKLGLSAPEMRLCPNAVSPFLTGWRGVIVAPERLMQSPERARHALVHELCHLRRGDERDRLLGSALTILLWFNWPLRQIECELDAAREIACDSDAVEALGRTQCKAYAATLIESMRSSAQPVSAFGPHNRRQREMRIRSILSGGQTVKHSLLTAGALLLLAVPVAYAQTTLTPRRVVSAPVEQIAPLVEARVLAQAYGQAERFEAALPNAAAVDRTAPDDGQNQSLMLAHRLQSGMNVEASTSAALIAEPVAPEVAPRQKASSPSPAPVAAAAPAATPQPVAAPDLSGSIVTGRITSAYGPRPARPAGSPVFHGGTDIAASTGTAISAPGAGTVVHAEMGYNGSERWGNTVEIDHGDGWSTVYAHLDAIGVASGQSVAPGQQIGTVGTTGASTGPHVHVELHFNGERVDPAGYLTGLD
ncbi:M23/M56 family metallopeptidase [Maricaulis salignorans]|uniref:BlaR1 peptidase M56 n=1 Tax=Maricaulis salignorans TaxID=144026 RepID=A0A1G9RP59_9PROT|nr:M23/M56 family metallopeptidase [Maricaulis salignorans]SDM25078.1 BlaR1 peptidase M56 [Maricaulis salignorans]